MAPQCNFGFRRFFLCVSFFLGLVQGVQADPLGANTGATLRLTGSTFQEGCFEPCMCPLMTEQPVLGTMKLVYAGFSNAEHSYHVQDVNWILPGADTNDRIVGTGKFRIGTPGPLTVLQHRLELDLQVGDDPAAHFDSGWQPYSNSGSIDIVISLNGIFCWDRVIHVAAQPLGPTDYQRFTLYAGSTFQRGCIDGFCECAVGPEVPLHGAFALVLLQDNSLFRTFAVVDIRWRAMNTNAVDGTPILGHGFYLVGGEVAVQNRLALNLQVGQESAQRYDSGMVSGGGAFPSIDVVTRTHTNCVDTLLHVIASPDGGSGNVCGGIMGEPCGEGEFCLLEPGHCCCDFQGVCTPLPQACPEYYDPVCGCDGTTYANPCFAAIAGQSIDHWGSCPSYCTTNDNCPIGSFCKFNLGTCGMTNSIGTCTPQPNGCPDVWDPVCGCNGITYSNECEADAAGASVRHLGICADPCQPTPDGFGCTSCLSLIPEDVCRPAVLHLDIHSGAITTTDCDCMNMSACHIEFGNASPIALGYCPTGETCGVVRRDSDNDGIDDTFWARCMSAAAGPCCFDIDDGPIRYDTCLPRTESACETEGGMFAGTNAGCEATQACCFADATICADLHPVCCVASDGQPGGPYSNCATTGCGDVCGGFAGIPCDDPNEFCKLPIGHCCCDHFGVCSSTGGSCPAEWDPVCGCDGATYSNECEADASGVSVDYRGTCGTPSCSATRILAQPNSHPCADASNLVRILLTPPSSATAIAVEKSLPQGWTAGNISHAGQYDAVHHKVKWGPFFMPFPSDLTYQISRTSNASPTPCISGLISIDGINDSICGESCLEPCCPQMAADQPHEPCGNCPVTDCNSCVASICGDSRIHMCEIVGYACAWLHGCHDDLAGMTRAAFVWRTGECYCWDDAANNWQSADCSTAPLGGCCNSQDRDIVGGDGGSTAVININGPGRGKASGGVARVWVDLDVSSTATAVALEVKVPKGWIATDVSDGGTWDPLSRKVRWGVFFDDLSRTVTFTARGPSKMSNVRNALSDFVPPARWSGVLSVDGVNQAAATGD